LRLVLLRQSRGGRLFDNGRTSANAAEQHEHFFSQEAVIKKTLIGVSAIAALIGTPALAADMLTKAPTSVPVTSYNWTGFYVGGQVGEGWDSDQITLTDNSSAPNFPLGYAEKTNYGRGMLGGGYEGYNYQINRYVIGIDGDYSWASLNGTSTDVGLVAGPGGVTRYHTDNIDWIATATGRLGYAVNNLMFFGKGGWAWAGDRRDTKAFITATGVYNSNATASDTRSGWTSGAGVEWGFAPNWSAKLEYDYVKFDTSNITVTAITVAGVGVVSGASATSSLNMVKLGAAYRF
jgi:outer membrane immunogenic protein